MNIECTILGPVYNVLHNNNIYILFTVSQYISYITSKENLFN